MRKSLRARFFASVSKTDTCWLWTASVWGPGYGQICEMVNGRRVNWGAHRLSWVLHNGPIPDGLLVCHSCDVQRCVNPSHLFLGTNRDNMLDMAKKGRCTRKAARFIGKLDVDTVRRIDGLVAQGELTQKAIANMFNIDPRSVRSIRDGKIHSAVTGRRIA